MVAGVVATAGVDVRMMRTSQSRTARSDGSVAVEAVGGVVRVGVQVAVVAVGVVGAVGEVERHNWGTASPPPLSSLA